MVMRLAGADVLPLDYEPYASRIQSFVDEVERDAMAAIGIDATNDAFADLRAAARELHSAAAAFNTARDGTLSGRKGGPSLDNLNAALLQVERQFIDPVGIPNRPWYRHQIYAPKYTYAPEVLPGLTEAVNARDARGASEQATRIASALRRAAEVLRLDGSQN
jgi:N-acetylated-alpha-linked acidic dipeptidase